MQVEQVLSSFFAKFLSYLMALRNFEKSSNMAKLGQKNEDKYCSTYLRSKNPFLHGTSKTRSVSLIMMMYLPTPLFIFVCAYLLSRHGISTNNPILRDESSHHKTLGSHTRCQFDFTNFFIFKITCLFLFYFIF